jgi:opacity protein-like surface antigen
MWRSKTQRLSPPACLTALAFLFAVESSAGQQEPAVEVFAIGGGYVHGNLLLSPQQSSIAPQWKPQVGGGVLAPLGRRWGALFDVTTSAVEAHWKWDGLPGAGAGDNFSRVRRVSLIPSLVRLWRRERFSIYAGAGGGIEHDRERNLFRRIVARDERGQPVLAGEFETTHVNKTHGALALRAGAIVGLGRRIVLRAGYSYLRFYADEPGSTGLEVGAGYRF